MKQPFPKTWWVKDKQLLAGCFPGTPEPNGTEQRVASLVEAGIRTFVCLQPVGECNREGKTFPNYEPVLKKLQSGLKESLQFYRFAVADTTAPAPKQMAEVLDAIDSSLAQKRPVYIHCWGGHGRTGAVIGCWLVRHGLSGKAALAKLEELRANYPEIDQEPTPPFPQQRKLVSQWADLDPALLSSRTMTDSSV